MLNASCTTKLIRAASFFCVRLSPARKHTWQVSCWRSFHSSPCLEARPHPRPSLRPISRWHPPFPSCPRLLMIYLNAPKNSATSRTPPTAASTLSAFLVTHCMRHAPGVSFSRPSCRHATGHAMCPAPTLLKWTLAARCIKEHMATAAAVAHFRFTTSWTSPVTRRKDRPATGHMTGGEAAARKVRRTVMLHLTPQFMMTIMT